MAYTLKIHLHGIEPAIWRTFVVGNHTTFEELHKVIQICLGWSNRHGWEFKDKEFCYPLDDNYTLFDRHGESIEGNSDPILIKNLLVKSKQKVLYIYDFLSYWEHTLEVKEIDNTILKVPKCIAGAGICPQEGSGGVMFMALDRPAHGSSIPPAPKANLEAINQILCHSFEKPTSQKKNMRRNIIYHTRIWGDIPFFSSFQLQQSVVWEVHEHYQKRSARNRYTILGPNGPQTLSIPLLKGKNSQTPIGDVLISYDVPWVKEHLQSIKTAYGKAPYFEYYFPYIESLYQIEYKSLLALNLASFQLLNKWLRIETLSTTTASFKGISEDPNPLALAKPYAQVFEYKYGFVPDLCIIDLLFCMGPESLYYL